MTLTSVLGVLLLDLGEVLELDGLPLEHGPLHVLDQLLLLLAEELILELHSMDLLPHRNDLGLTDGWVKSILHLLLELDFTLPEQDLALSLNDFSEDVTFLVLEVGNLHFESN